MAMLWQRRLVVSATACFCLGWAGGWFLTSAGPAAARPTGPVPVADGSAPDQKDGVRVTIDNFSFNPPTLTIDAGTKVTWINRDDVPHTATSTSKPRLFASGTLDTDERFSFVFKTPGSYEYFCAVHPKMTGKVIVK